MSPQSRTLKGEDAAAGRPRAAPSARSSSPLSIYDHSCIACRLHDGAKTVCVSGDGPKRAHGMIVGEAPGRLEDDRGIPFIGQAGTKLNNALLAAGVRREDVFVTNAVKCRPPHNRTPYITEIDICVSLYLSWEIMTVKPKAILACGNAACSALLGVDGITSLRGHWAPTYLGRKDTPVLPTWHPAALLYDPNKIPEFNSDVAEFVKGWQ